MMEVNNKIPDISPLAVKLDKLETKLSKIEPEKPTELRNKLESLKGEERLDKKAIRGLKEDIDALRKEIQSKPVGKLGMRKIPIVKSINLTSQVDGVVTTYTLPKDTVEVLGVWSTQFPVNFNGGTDWTFAGNTLTLTSEVGVIQSGQTLWALVETLFYG